MGKILYKTSGVVGPPVPPWDLSRLLDAATILTPPANGGSPYTRVRPAYQETYYDTAHVTAGSGVPVTRITGENGSTIVGASKWGLINRTHYPTDSPWNCDQTVIWISNISGGLANVTGAFISATPPYTPLYVPVSIPSGGEVRWHPTDPALMLYASGSIFGTWNPQSGVKSTIRDFALDGYTSLAFNGKGRLSWNGQSIAMTGTHAGVQKMFVYDFVNDIKYANITHPTAPLGRLSVSASGLRVYFGADGGADDEKDWFYNRDGTLITTTPMDPLKLSHYDTFLDGSTDLIIGRSRGFSGTTGGQIYKVDMSDGTAAMTPIQTRTGYQNHTSCQDLTGAWALTGFVNDGNGYVYDDELVVMRPDGTENRRVCHMHSLEGAGPQYETEMQPVQSPDGGQMIWHCNWETARDAVPVTADSYLADVRAL